VFGASFVARGNFVAVPGLAILIPALVVLSGRLACRWPNASVPILLSAVIAGTLLSARGHRTLLFETLTAPTLFGSYPTHRKVAVAAYAVALTLLATSALVAIVRRHRPGRAQRIGSFPQRTRRGREAHLIATAFAAFALLASLLHFSAKQEFLTEWTQQTSLLANLRLLAPKLMDDTFVIIVDQRPNRGSAPYMAHDEVSASLLAVYDNFSLMGNTPRHLLFSRQGITTTYHRLPVTWFPRGTRGPVRTHATEPVGPITYDRVVLFRYDGQSLSSLPQIAVTTEAGEPLIVKSNRERILSSAPPTVTRIWRHITR
jgi:hypothetical protein